MDILERYKREQQKRDLFLKYKQIIKDEINNINIDNETSLDQFCYLLNSKINIIKSMYKEELLESNLTNINYIELECYDTINIKPYRAMFNNKWI